MKTLNEFNRERYDRLKAEVDRKKLHREDPDLFPRPAPVLCPLCEQQMNDQCHTDDSRGEPFFMRQVICPCGFLGYRYFDEDE